MKTIINFIINVFRMLVTALLSVIDTVGHYSTVALTTVHNEARAFQNILATFVICAITNTPALIRTWKTTMINTYRNAPTGVDKCVVVGKYVSVTAFSAFIGLFFLKYCYAVICALLVTAVIMYYVLIIMAVILFVAGLMLAGLKKATTC